MRLLPKLALLAALGTPALFALTCSGDTSGNSTLKGAYRFRNVFPVNYDTSGNVKEVIAASGIITFNGAGGYSVTGTYVDNTQNSGKSQTLPAIPTSASGCYAIGSNGIGYLANPVLLAVFGGTYVEYEYGAVSQGVFSGSMTEAGNNAANGGYYLADLFVAIPAGTPTNASFNTPFWTGVLDFTSGLSTHLKNALFKLSPNGSGGLAGIVMAGQDASQGSGSPMTQVTAAGTYNFASDGTGTLNIPVPTGVSTVNALFTGAKTMYVSSDGAFVLGWSATGYDIIFGVRTLTSTAAQNTFQGTYYTSALELGVQPFCSGSSGLDAYTGSLSADGTGNAIVHQRLWSAECLPIAYDYTTDDYANLNLDGTIANTDYNGYSLAFGDGGNAFVGISGSSGFFSLVVGLKAASFSGSGVYLNPTGIVNAGSFAPITAPLAPGELITMFGSGLAPATLVSTGGLPFPTNLGGVQVTIAGIAAPIYYVSSGQLSVIVPYGLANSTGLAQVQINNNGVLSNTVTLYGTDALAGIFTQSQNGIGYAAALHPDGSLVTPTNPAQPGETLAVYLTGLGTVSPTITDGSLGPSNPLSYVDEFTDGYGNGGFIVYFNDYGNDVFESAAVSYAGLAPGLAGLYQLNVTVPSDVGPGDVYIEVVTYQADVNQAQVSVSGGTSAARPAARSAGAASGRRIPVHGAAPSALSRPKTAPRTPPTPSQK
ncbi:MAG TPA: IPT/TIG domain-containing protein [Bryobacteraceae bacterium]|jgi:uncharacterized protein (TIGR03437 family)